MKIFLRLFNRKREFTKDDLMSFKNYWQRRQSPFGFAGEDEKLFNEWIAKK